MITSENIKDFMEEYTIPKKICDNFINYHKKNTEYKRSGSFIYHERLHQAPSQAQILERNSQKKSTDVYFYNNSNSSFIKKFFKYLSESVQNYCDKYNISFPVKTHICNNIQYYKPNEGVPVLHYEKNNGSSMRRELVYMLYCNDLKNGGTHFPNQNKTLQARKGKMYIWPAFFTHPHQGVISSIEEKL